MNYLRDHNNYLASEDKDNYHIQFQQGLHSCQYKHVYFVFSIDPSYNFDFKSLSSNPSITDWNFIASPISPSSLSLPVMNSSAACTSFFINFTKSSSVISNVHVGSSTPPLIIFLFPGSMHHTLLLPSFVHSNWNVDVMSSSNSWSPISFETCSKNLSHSIILSTLTSLFGKAV